MSLLVPSLSPGDPGAPGSDFAGVILEGEGAGNSVLGLSTGVLASEVVASANTVAMLPLHLSFEAGATTPTIFVTAHAALAQAACLQSDVLVPQQQPAALLTAATTQVLDLPSTSSTVSAPGLSYTCTWLATSPVELCSHGSARPDTAPHLMLEVGPSCNALDVLKNMLPVLHFTAAVDHTTGLAVSSFGAYSYVAASGLTGAHNSTPISSAARAAAAAGWGSLRSAVMEVPDLSLTARDFSASDTTAPHVHVLMELNRTATGIRDELATPAELHLYGNTTVAGVIHTAQLTRLHHSMATWPPKVTGGILSETERRGTFIVTGISITCLAHQLLWNIIGSAQHSD